MANARLTVARRLGHTLRPEVARTVLVVGATLRRRRCWLPLLAFLGCALLVHLRFLAPLDLAVMAALGGTSARCEAVALATALETLAIPQVSVGMSLALVAWLWWRGRGIRALWPLVLYAGLPIELAAKTLVVQPVPTAFFTAAYRCTTGPRPLLLHTANSFPSGNALRLSFFALLALAALERSGLPAGPRRALQAAVALFAAFALALRLVPIAHWPSDLLGGVLLATPLAALAWAGLTAPASRRERVRLSLPTLR